MGLLNLDQAHQALDGAGNPAPHAQRFVYLAGTAALAPLYKDADLTVRQANPMTWKFPHARQINYQILRRTLTLGAVK